MQAASSSSSAPLNPFMAIESPDIRSYTEMTKRIPGEDMTKIEEKMESLPDFDPTLRRIQRFLRVGKYRELPEDAFYYVLRGLKEAKTPEEGEVLAKMVARVSDIETLRLQGVDFQVYRFEDLPEAFIYQTVGRNLSGGKLATFIEEVKSLPREDRRIMVFTPKSPKKKLREVLEAEAKPKLSSQVTISQDIESRAKVNIFNRFKNGGKYLRMSAPLKMYETFLKVRFDNNHVKANPVLGVSTVDQLEINGLTDTRDVCSLYVVPDGNQNKLVTYNEADGHRCEENDFNFHDRYHQFVVSSIGPKARKLAATIAQGFKAEFLSGQEKTLSLKDREAVELLHSSLVDMDYASGFSLEKGLPSIVKQIKFLYGQMGRPELTDETISELLSQMGVSEKKYTFYPHSIPLSLSKLATASLGLLLNKEAHHVPGRFETLETLEKAYSWIMSQVPGDEEYQKERVAKQSISTVQDPRLFHAELTGEQKGIPVTFMKRIFSMEN